MTNLDTATISDCDHFASEDVREKLVTLAEEKTALVKPDLESFFQFKIQAFEKHIKANNPIKVNKNQFVRNSGK